MTCATIMSREPLAAMEGDSIGLTAARIVEHGMIAMPVVDAENRFVGLFGIYDLLSLLIPRVAVIGNLQPNLRFVGSDIGELKARFAALKDKPLRHAVNRDAPRVHPDTPIAEAIRLFGHNNPSLAVVERGSGGLVGMISYWDVARLLIGPS